MNFNIADKLKQLLFDHIEKVILALLLITLITTVFRSTFSLFHESQGPENPSFLIQRTKDIIPQSPFTSKEFDQLIEMIKLTLSPSQNKTRNLFELQNEELAQTEPEGQKTDTDQDGIPDEWEIKYGLDPSNPKDAVLDLDEDSYSNLDEFLAGTDPSDSNSFPGMIKLKVQRIYRKDIKVKFLGYIKLPGDTYQMQINWGKRTYFLKMGEELKGYTLLEFTPSTENIYDAGVGADLSKDVSSLKIQKQNDPPITLILEKPSFEKEYFAELIDSVSRKMYLVHPGSKIITYKVLDITSSKVIISRKHKNYTLGLEQSKVEL